MLDTTGLGGRFGNRFFQNMVVNILSRKFNLPAKYEFLEEYSNLGIDLFCLGTQQYTDTLVVTEDNVNILMRVASIDVNLILDQEVYFQTPVIAGKIRCSLNIEKIKRYNPYISRYNNNADLFVHVRIGDLENKNLTPGIDYYEKILSSIDFTNGYISTDTPNHPFVEHLIRKYSLQYFLHNEIETIQFGSTCKYIVTAGGTFSWLIALLGFHSEVFYPKDHLNWHGDIYGFPDWKGT
jgi:hypothetical protein